jgi:hypothetical protein
MMFSRDAEPAMTGGTGSAAEAIDLEKQPKLRPYQCIVGEGFPSLRHWYGRNIAQRQRETPQRPNQCHQQIAEIRLASRLDLV